MVGHDVFGCWGDDVSLWRHDVVTVRSCERENEKVSNASYSDLRGIGS